MTARPPARIRVAAIVAVARNGVIGRDNALPWHLPADLKYFRTITMGKPVIMGRKTFDSIGRPLPGRDNFVVTRDAAWQAPGVTALSGVDVAIMAAKKAAAERDIDEVMIIGGTEIYAQSLPLTDRLYITEVGLEPEGDSYFPPIDPELWQEQSRAPHAATDASPAYSFVVFDRRR